ncbi:MAG TPA: AzlC family ABC transporter permease [Deferrisomatales bacterium]|nr:AzlC family ABC transporter permease [Deferrisomatales bacterium]
MPSATRSALIAGARAASPICLGYLPIGLAFGVLAQKAGLTPWQVTAMSVLVFAGSAQFIAVAMLQEGAAAAAIVVTTLVVNLRHFLMSSALSVPLRGRGRGFLALFAYGVTDESFAVNNARFRAGGWDGNRALAVNHTANLCWVMSTVLGTRVGQVIPAGAFGVDYALPAMFLALLVIQMRTRLHGLAAAVAGLVALIWSVTLPGNGQVVPAAVLGASAAFAAGRWARRREGRA